MSPPSTGYQRRLLMSVKVALVVTGTGFPSNHPGATNDIVANKFTFTGEGSSTHTLTDTSNVEITSGTTFTLTLSSTDKTALVCWPRTVIVTLDATTWHNLGRRRGLAVGAAFSGVVADLTGNGVIASTSPVWRSAASVNASSGHEQTATYPTTGDTIDVSNCRLARRAAAYTLTTSIVTAASSGTVLPSH